ncbi:MAG: DNA polymerase III subunit gamma/tau, partial [Defluviitaleaceae bacterium]|nr:DNA polymerase III subunit gamma/tau [Defluviitaleaceae bacterium]
NGEPCNVCASCEAILSEKSLNIIEIDAASNNGVDNIRNLREEVRYSPAEGRYRVYIVDEVHMFSANAFNALLKTLEEPPPYVVFILATTDPHKIPPTILSRCQRYDFKRITIDDMTAALKKYLAEEESHADDAALRYIASVSDGALRDALSILDQCLSFYRGESVTLEKVMEILGTVDPQVLFDFSDALRLKDSMKVLAVINQVVKDGRDIEQFAADLTRHFRDLLVAAQTGGNASVLEHTDEMINKLLKHGKKFETEQLIAYIYSFSELIGELKYSASDRLSLEVNALKLCCGNNNEKPAGVLTPAAEIKTSDAKTSQKYEDKKPAEYTAADNQPDWADAGEYETNEKKPCSANIIAKNWLKFCAVFSGFLLPVIKKTKPDFPSDGIVLIICENSDDLKYLKSKEKEISLEMQKFFTLNPAPDLLFKTGDPNRLPENKPAAADDFRESIAGQINMDIDFE